MSQILTQMRDIERTKALKKQIEHTTESIRLLESRITDRNSKLAQWSIQNLKDRLAELEEELEVLHA